MKTFIISFIITISLYGCSQWHATKMMIAQGGANAADEALKVAVWHLCNASTYGSIKRAFGDSPQKAQAIRVLCATDLTEVNLIEPLDEHD